MTDRRDELMRVTDETDLADATFWVFHALSEIKDDQDLPRVQAMAPSPGAATLLEFAHKYKLHFFKEILPKAFARRSKDSMVRDDGRKRVEIFDPIYDQIVKDYTAKRECPMCGRQLTKHTALFRRPQKAS